MAGRAGCYEAPHLWRRAALGVMLACKTKGRPRGRPFVSCYLAFSGRNAAASDESNELEPT